MFPLRLPIFRAPLSAFTAHAPRIEDEDDDEYEDERPMAQVYYSNSASLPETWGSYLA